MRVAMIACVAAALSAGSLARADSVTRPADHSARDVVAAIVRDMSAASTRARDVTYTLYRQEYTGGRMQPQHVIACKVRKEPADLYMKWIGSEHTGREILFSPQRNGGKLKVKAWPFNLNLDPLGRLANRSSRHNITEAGLFYVVDTIGEGLGNQSVPADAERSYDDLGMMTVHGEEARCYRVTQPKDRYPALYGYVSETCMNLRTQLPALVKTWDLEDGKVRLVETYTYEKIEVDVGLGDADFDTENPAYGF